MHGSKILSYSLRVCFSPSRPKLSPTFQLGSLERWGKQALGSFLQEGRVGTASTQCFGLPHVLSWGRSTYHYPTLPADAQLH